LPKAKLAAFEARMTGHLEELRRLAREVQDSREEIIRQAKERRGRAFDEGDYPADLATLFDLSWSYSSLVISDELKAVSATAYAAERTRQTARLLGAVRLAEEQSVRRLHELAGKLSARLEALDRDLAPGESRLPFTADAVGAVGEFCAHFSEVVCWGADDVAEVVAEAGGAVDGVSLEELREDAELRQTVRGKLGEVGARLAALVPALAGVVYPGTTRKAKKAEQAA
jgi:hypothetical protein